MGWSCTTKASDAMDRLTEACVKASGGSQNEFPESNGVWLFWEVDRVEFDDGHVTGEVHRMLPGHMCRHECRFVITPEGRLEGGHKWMRDVLAS
jgi:hypothetical protein